MAGKQPRGCNSNSMRQVVPHTRGSSSGLPLREGLNLKHHCYYYSKEMIQNKHGNSCKAYRGKHSQPFSSVLHSLCTGTAENPFSFRKYQSCSRQNVFSPYIHLLTSPTEAEMCRANNSPWHQGIWLPTPLLF